MPRAKAQPQQPQGAILGMDEAARLQAEQPGRYEVIGGADRPWFSWQERVLLCTADEIALLGGKGSGKSEVMRAWLVTGNPNEHDFEASGAEIPWNQTYTRHPDYRGLILRKNEGDLADFVKRAQRMWTPYGGEYKNGRFEFPAGAVIDVGHMRDESAWTKYIGIEFQRIAIDEAGLIKEYSLFDELRSCMRSPYAELRCQVLLASNAGGPGTSWLIERYMKARDANNVIVPHDNIITEDFIHPFTGEKRHRTRIWMFSTIEDNPIYKQSDYAITLISMADPKRRRAYFEGHWDALFGSYFGDLFRPEGPVRSNSEPDNASHVLHPDAVTKKYPIEIKSWHHISMGGDWGYAHEAAFLWARQVPDGRVVIYRELVASQTSPERLGYEIGMQSRTELEALPSHSFVLHLGHDAFNNRAGDKSIAELIALGIARVLGPNAVHLPDLMIRRIKESFERGGFNQFEQTEREKAIEAIRLQRRLGITIRIAEKTSVIGWQHCRELMRWESIGVVNSHFDREQAYQLLSENPKAFEEYCRLYRDVPPEILPRLQILDSCPRLIDAIPRLQHDDGTEAADKGHFKGRDSVDCFSYLVTGLLDELPPEPFEAFRDRHIENASQAHPDMSVNDLVRMNMALEHEWKDKTARTVAPFTPPRHARSRRLLMQGKLKMPAHKNIDNILGLN